MKNTTWIQSDYYFNHQSDFDKRSDIFGSEYVPVSLNGGIVVKQQDKYGEDPAIGEQTQQNIRERFSLEAPNDGDDDDIY